MRILEKWKIQHWIETNRQLCFVHIPKTAGLSFTEILRFIVGRKNLLFISPEILSGYKDLDQDVNGFAALCGHFTYEIYDFLRIPPLYLTFLRNPLTRSISNYQEHRRMNLSNSFITQLPVYEFYKQLDKMTFGEFIDHPFFNEAVTNLQTRMLGIHSNIPAASLSGRYPITNDKRYFSLNLAKERLEKFLFFGIQEKFQMSMDMVSYQFGLFPSSTGPKLNVSTQENCIDDLPDSLINRLSEKNDLDIELYNYGLKLFEERYNQMLFEMNLRYAPENLSVIEMLSREYMQYSERARDFLYELDTIYPKQGWYDVESTQDQQWMWSGPENVSSVDLPLDRSVDLQVVFRIVWTISEEILESLQIFVDAQPLYLHRTFEDGRYIYIGLIPADSGKEKYISTRFTFQVSHTAYPRGMTAADIDARLLGIALNSIKIKNSH